MRFQNFENCGWNRPFWPTVQCTVWKNTQNNMEQQDIRNDQNTCCKRPFASKSRILGVRMSEFIKTHGENRQGTAKGWYHYHQVVPRVVPPEPLKIWFFGQINQFFDCFSNFYGRQWFISVFWRENVKFDYRAPKTWLFLGLAPQFHFEIQKFQKHGPMCEFCQFEVWFWRYWSWNVPRIRFHHLRAIFDCVEPY